jgi:hypothetical protein
MRLLTKFEREWWLGGGDWVGGQGGGTVVEE